MKKSLFSLAIGSALLGVSVLVLPPSPSPSPPEPETMVSSRPEAVAEKPLQSTSKVTPSIAREPTERTLRRLAEDMATLRRLVSELGREQLAMRQWMDALSQQPEVQTDYGFDPQQPEPSVAEEQIQQTIWRQESALEEQLRSERVDAQWAAQTLEVIDEGFKNEALAGIWLVDAGCASTLCQLELSMDEDVPIEEGMQRLSMHRSWQGPTFVSVGSDGIARIYFAREGYELPGSIDGMEPAL